MSVTLEQVEAMVDELCPEDRARLQRYVVEALVKECPAVKEVAQAGSIDPSWQAFRLLLDEMAKMPTSQSSASALDEIRR